MQEIKGRMLRDQLGARLIEESGANFEAEIVKPFSNKPSARRSAETREAAPRGPARGDPDASLLRVGEGGL